MVIFVIQTICSLIGLILLFFTWEDFGLENKESRIIILLVVLVVSATIGMIYILFVKRNREVWKHGNGKIIICYSDIIKQGIKKNVNSERIVVIPFNTCFDTIVDFDIATVEKPMISPKSIHGQWIITMNNNGVTVEELNEKIKSYISHKNISPIKELQIEKKKKGNLLVYERGTVVPYKFNEKVTFFLFALSEFDENNKAQCNKDEFVDCIKRLIDYYNTNGQGFELYLPLMGTNLSRVGMSHREALKTIKTVFELYSDRIHGVVNIIIYENDKEKVSIYD